MDAISQHAPPPASRPPSPRLTQLILLVDEADTHLVTARALCDDACEAYELALLDAMMTSLRALRDDVGKRTPLLPAPPVRGRDTLGSALSGAAWQIKSLATACAYLAVDDLANRERWRELAGEFEAITDILGLLIRAESRDQLALFRSLDETDDPQTVRSTRVTRPPVAA